MSDDELKQRSDGLAPELVRWRRHLHRHPELGYDVHETAAFVESRLRELGLEVRTGIGETGLVGMLRASAPDGPAILLRADMDALPVQEVDGREYGSQVPGRMHACGHDGHMAMMLGAATLLSERKDSLTRDVVFCFQPAEEGGGGGQRMVEEGVLDVVETGAVYALHLWSQWDAGTVYLRPGPIMAAVDEFTARIVGRGGHAAMPHDNIDPVLAGAQAVVTLQSIVSRNVDPMEPAVVTVGAFNAGSATNVIPDFAELKGTMRSFTDDVRQLLRRRVPELLENVARACGCTLEFELLCGYPAVVNDPRAVEIVRREARIAVGEANVREPAPMACAEDFSFFLNERPGAFIFVGAGSPQAAPHHSPEFDIDETALPRGAELLARLALSPDQP